MGHDSILQAGVRSDLADAHSTTFAELALPGDWLRADERTAVIAVVRAARAQPEQPPWYRPSSDGMDFAPLPPAAADAAWRLTNHPGTLTPDWFSDTVKDLPSVEYYVEVVGIVAVVNAMDRLATLLDTGLMPIPEPAPGEPARPSIESAVSTHWVPTAIDARGPNVLRALDLAPTTVAMRTRIGATHYMDAAGRADLNWSRGVLDRRQIELLAGVTSLHNECFY